MLLASRRLTQSLEPVISEYISLLTAAMARQRFVCNLIYINILFSQMLQCTQYFTRSQCSTAVTSIAKIVFFLERLPWTLCILCGQNEGRVSFHSAVLHAILPVE